MIQFTGTFNQVIKGSGKKFGGALVVFEGHPQLLVGGFNYDLNDLPPAGVVLPCGTPVYCDEANRTITPLVTASVESVSQSDAKVVTLKDIGFGGCAFNVGDTIGILPSDLSTALENAEAAGNSPAVTNYVTIAAIDGNVITLSAAISALKAGDVLVQLDADSHEVKVIPNAITPYDVVRSADAISVDGDGMIGNDRPLLERRMPPYNDALKAAVQANGHKLTFSNRK